MKRREFLKKWRGSDLESLRGRLVELADEGLRGRFRQAFRQGGDSSRGRVLRREIAMLKTIERELLEKQ